MGKESMSDVFIARQPIFDADLAVYAYELLFRHSRDAVSADVFDGDGATSHVMLSSFVDIGLNNLVGKHAAFFNLTEHFLTNPDLIVIPPEQVVLEILEDVEPTEAVIDSVRELKKRRYTIALDDFIYDDKFIPLLECADIVKVDVTLESHAKIKSELINYEPYNVKLLAEKIETYEEFEFFKKIGFEYFQGYFFSRPKIIQGKGLAPNKLSLLQLVAKVNDPDIEIAGLSQIISTDISLSHKVLKYINSPSSGIRATIDSIQQAVTLLGMATIKNWVTVMAMSSNSGKPIELSTTALVRAKICQGLAKHNKLDKPDSYFTVGLFSALDAMMDQSFDVLMDDLPLSDEAKNGIKHLEGSYGEALQCAFSMEQSDFSVLDFMGLDLGEMSDLYLEAVKWSDDMLRSAQ